MSLVFTALLLADLHYVRVLLDDLPLFADGEIQYRAVLLTVLLLGGVNVILMAANGAANLLYEYLEKHVAARMTREMSRKAARVDLIQFESSLLFDGIEKAIAGRERPVPREGPLLERIQAPPPESAAINHKT